MAIMKASFTHESGEYEILIWQDIDGFYMYAIGQKGTVKPSSLPDTCFSTLSGCIGVMMGMVKWGFGDVEVVWEREHMTN